MNRKVGLIIDLVALGLYLLAANPALTGVAVHEWAGLGVLVVFWVHVAVHFDEVFDTVRRTLSNRSLRRVGNFVVDALAVVALMICIVSGVMVSGAVLPAFGYYSDGYYFWNPLHALSAKALLAILVVHALMHARRIVYLGRALGNASRKGNGNENDKTARY